VIRRVVLAVLLVACGATQTDPPDRPVGVPPRGDGGGEGGGGVPDGSSTSTLDGGGDGTTVVVGEDAGSDARVDGAECTTSSSIAAPTAPAGGLLLLAYGPIGFSGTQGKCGWSYGYVAPATSSAFVAMGEYDALGEAWYVQNGVYWTYMGRSFMHPNGVTTSGGRTAVDHWAVRRWTSNLTAAIRITGVAKKPVGGNGTVARVMVGANVMFEQTIVDDVGMSFDIVANVSLGTNVDFVLDPNLSDDGADSTDFTAAIWR
jgi:hypothetical protein